MVISIFDYNKLILKKITILIPKFKENMLSFLAPIIGIYGIKINLFIDDFENKTNFFEFDILIPVEVVIYKINTFDLSIKLPYLNFYLNEFYHNISLLYIYKLSVLKSLNKKKLLVINYKIIRSYINSIHKIKNKFKLLKYNFYIIKDIINLLLFKKLYNNFFYKLNFLNINYGIYVSINNINFYVIKNQLYLNIIKLKSNYNFYLLGTNNINKFLINIRILDDLKLKNKMKLFFIKYKKNNLSFLFFNKFIKEKIIVNNYIKIFNNNLYKLFFLLLYNLILYKNIICIKKN